MKQRIKEIIIDAANRAYTKGLFISDKFPKVEVEEPRIDSYGDFSTNFAMVSAGIQKTSPRKIAEIIIKNMNNYSEIIEEPEIAGPGFINFFIKPGAWRSVLKRIHRQGELYGASNIGKERKVQVEFVSSNPTGPLHIGHGRGAALGDAISRILSFCGYKVQKEYYINDAGTQINTLGRSVFLRYLRLLGKEVDFPETCYQGDYIKDYAKLVKDKRGDEFLNCDEDIAISFCADIASEGIINSIKQDLKDFGVSFDNWFSEQSLHKEGKVDHIIEDLSKKNFLYKKDGALWFKSSGFGDEKDRVVIRKDGHATYFASDMAYHKDKFDRGFDMVIDVWGADHHGYIPRIKASISASGYDSSLFKVILVKLVNLMRNRETIAMSTRAGEFITLKEIVDEVGKDAARFIFLTRSSDSSLDFDLDVAKKQTNDNPVFYVQYVHARISSIVSKFLKKEQISIEPDNAYLSRLKAPEETNLIKILAGYPDTILNAAISTEPHRISFYLLKLAAEFHSYYNKHRVITDDHELTIARLCLILGVQKVIKSGLSLLGVYAPERM